MRLEKTERNAEIVRMHVEERLTLSEIGRRLNLTRARIHQLVRRAGVTESTTRRIQTEAAMREWIQPVCEQCGQAGPATQPYRVKEFCSRECGDKHKDAVILRELRRIALVLGRTPNQADLPGEYGETWFMTYHRRFGSLRRAQTLAGLTPNKVGGHGPSRVPTPLPAGFREQWAHLLEEATA